MAVLLSPVGGAAAQFLDNNGNPLLAGKLFTYAAGTTTNQAVYTNASGVTPHTNPIILDAGGRVPGGEIWLTDGLQYKFVLQNANDVLIGTYDNLVGINSNFVNFLTETEVQTATAGQTVFTLTTMQYQPGTNNLTVYVDGVNQIDGATYSYVETSSTVVTFTAGLHVGALVKFTTAQALSTGVTDASLVTYSPPFTGFTPTTVEAKLAQTVSVMDFGAVGDGVTNDHAAINSAIDYAESIGGAVIYFPAATYNCTDASNQFEIIGDNITLSGYGATLLNVRLFVRQTSQNLIVLGIKFLDNRSSGATYFLDLYNSHFTFQDVTLEKNPSAGGVQAYIRTSSSYGVFRGLRTFGSNGIFVSGHDHTFIGCQLVCRGLTAGAGTDDAYAIKALPSVVADPAQTYNISIIGGSVSGFYNIIGIGSDVGKPNAPGDYSSWVKNVTVSGVTAYKCTTLAYIKPGALTDDYRNGLVQNVIIDGCTLLDPDGTNFTNGMILTVGRGARINAVTMSNCIIRARASTTSVLTSGVYIRTAGLIDNSAISNVNVNNCQFIDEYLGVANSPSTPGFPIGWAAYIERANIGAFTDVIARVSFNGNYFRGTKDGGIGFENQPQGFFKFTNNILETIGVNPVAGSYAGVTGLTSTTDSSFYGNVIQPAPGSSQRPAGAADFYTKSDTAVCYLGSAGAGTSIQNPFFIAPNDCYVWKIELVNSAAITQSDTDYSTYEFRNMSTGNPLETVTTKLTGGIAVPDDSPPVSISASSFTNANAYFPKNSVMRFNKADSGAGQPISNMYAIVHYLAYNN